MTEAGVANCCAEEHGGFRGDIFREYVVASSDRSQSVAEAIILGSAEGGLFVAGCHRNESKRGRRRIVSDAVNDQGQREALGMAIGASEAETF